MAGLGVLQPGVYPTPTSPTAAKKPATTKGITGPYAALQQAVPAAPAPSTTVPGGATWMAPTAPATEAAPSYSSNAPGGTTLNAQVAWDWLNANKANRPLVAGAAGAGGVAAGPMIMGPRPIDEGLRRAQALMDMFGGGGGAGGDAGVGAGTGSMAREPIPSAPGRATLDEPDLSEGEAASFARAKDQVARMLEGARRSLSETQTARGFGGESGVYAAEEGKLLSEGLRTLGEVSREQAMEAAARKRESALARYQGDISQRGQELGLAGTVYGGGITQRGQDINAAQGRYSILPSLLQLLAAAY